MLKFTTKTALLFAAFAITTGSAVAQVTDSSSATRAGTGTVGMRGMQNVPKSRQSQQRDYEAGKYPFPAKRKNNWSVGLQLGVPFVSGDINSKSPIPGFGFGLNTRKSFGHTFSMRAQFVAGQTAGISGTPSSQRLNAVNDAVNGKNNPDANYVKNPNVWMPNYQMTFVDGSLQGMVHLNNINFYKKQTNWGIYGFAGIGITSYHTNVNALNGNSLYEFKPEADSRALGTKEKDVIKAVKAKLDDTYETPGQGFTKKSVSQMNSLFMWTAGAGITYRLTRRIDLTFEHRITLVNTDLLDGKRYTAVSSSIFNTTDFDNYGFTSLGINFRLGKGQESLWWTNPVSDVYEQVADASKRMKDATTDTDGDGIADVFDKEPNTPAGATVDSKGVTIDSDKDGVPDYLDKEPFSTPGATVDNAGRAVPKNYTQDGPHDPNDLNDPFNPNSNFYKGAMAALGGAKPNGGGSNWFLPIIHFDLDRSNIKPEYYPELLQVATVLRNNPNMKLVVTGHTDIRASESYNMGLSQRRADAAIDHLVRKYNIDRSRLQVEAKGETNVLVTGLPDSYVPSKERAQGVNRRVEFRVAGTNAVLGTK